MIALDEIHLLPRKDQVILCVPLQSTTNLTLLHVNPVNAAASRASSLTPLGGISCPSATSKRFREASRPLLQGIEEYAI